ncbi:hypothetical protein Pst134EB_001358 [Puccinia striiformis f. sp. tritici]|nr:hypothetical protein Pst134EB_001358 [Puccinia striiformis f. sp. tritici]
MLVTDSDSSFSATDASNTNPGTRISPELPARLVPHVPTSSEGSPNPYRQTLMTLFNCSSIEDTDGVND